MIEILVILALIPFAFGGLVFIINTLGDPSFWKFVKAVGLLLGAIAFIVAMIGAFIGLLVWMYADPDGSREALAYLGGLGLVALLIAVIWKFLNDRGAARRK